MNWEPPIANALLIAERVFRDRDSGEWIIAGVFNRINGPSMPFVHQRMDVFIQVTNVSRPVDLRLRIEHADGEVVLEAGGQMASGSPLNVIERSVIIQGLIFRKPGKYYVQLMSEQEVLTAAPLFVTVLKEASHEPGPAEPHTE